MDVIPRANTVLKQHEAADAAQPSGAKMVGRNIQEHVYGIQKAERATELARLETMYYHIQISQTVDRYRALPQELARGVGHKTVCLTKYVEATYRTPEEVKRASENESVMRKGRAHWKKKKTAATRSDFLSKLLGSVSYWPSPPTCPHQVF